MELKEGEVVCRRCKGDGVIPFDENKYEICQWSICPRCKGDGKLDWVLNITSGYEKLFDVWFSRDVFELMVSKAKERRSIKRRK